jgi:hypothetical protein
VNILTPRRGEDERENSNEAVEDEFDESINNWRLKEDFDQVVDDEEGEEVTQVSESEESDVSRSNGRHGNHCRLRNQAIRPQLPKGEPTLSFISAFCSSS